ncbi:MAG: energy transducer TonB [Bacteroidetes bacterium]|nr:energy transducer TonB [Bacteroidota bacterium]
MFYFKRLFLLLVFSTSLWAQKGVYQFNVDNFPSIDGGNQEIKRFLHDHLIYPAQELKEKKEGTVRVFFIVTKSGKSEQLKINQTLSPACDKEALRLVKLIEWQPSHKGGTAVDVNFSLDVPFSVSKYKKAVKQRGFDSTLHTDFPSDTGFSVYETAERMPVFNNTEQTFPEFVYAQLQYPDVAMRQNIEGNMNVTFIIEPDGMTSNIKILNGGLAGGCNDEAIRVIGLSKWIPALRDKKQVRYRMHFTMKFSLKNTFKDNANGTQRNWGQ